MLSAGTAGSANPGLFGWSGMLPGLLMAAGGIAAIAWGGISGARRQRRDRASLLAVAHHLRDVRTPAGDAEKDATEAAAAAASLIRALRESDRALRAMFDGVALPIIATDGAGIITVCNTSGAEFCGREAMALLGRRIEEVLTQADLLDLHASARSGHAHSRLLRVPRASGLRIYEVFVSPLGRDGGPPGTIMTLRDATEESRMVQVRTDFVANASHELRTPITALRMAIDTLDSGGPDPDMQRRLMAMISGHIARLEEMTHDLLDLSRLESPELKVASDDVAASALARELASLFAQVCRARRLGLSFDLDPALESMRTDRGLLLLILKNLIDNAAKFADEGSTVRVLGRAIPNGPWGGVRFEVIDQGLGIPLNQQDRIFERFYQIDEARSGHSAQRGTGLGLAIVKHALRTLGGQIKVQSVWKQGTTMIVEIPAVLPPRP